MSPLYVLYAEVFVQVLHPFLLGLFVFLLLSHISSLSILKIKPLCKVSLANMFSHTVGFFFILMMISLAVQNLFSLMWFHLFILSFTLGDVSLALGDVLVKILLRGISEIFLLMFSSRLLYLSFFIHIEFILVHDVSCSSLIFLLHVLVQFSHRFLYGCYLILKVFVVFTT